MDESRRGFLAKMLAGGFGLLAGQAVKVEAVESKIIPAGDGEVMIETWRFPGVFIDSVSMMPTHHMIERRIRGETDFIDGRREMRVDCSFLCQSHDTSVSFSEAIHERFIKGDRLEVIIRKAR